MRIVCLKKKLCKPQNPYNSFYFDVHKCIGNTANSTPIQKMKKNISIVITEIKEKGILGC